MVPWKEEGDTDGEDTEPSESLSRPSHSFLLKGRSRGPCGPAWMCVEESGMYEHHNGAEMSSTRPLEGSKF